MDSNDGWLSLADAEARLSALWGEKVEIALFPVGNDMHYGAQSETRFAWLSSRAAGGNQLKQEVWVNEAVPCVTNRAV